MIDSEDQRKKRGMQARAGCGVLLVAMCVLSVAYTANTGIDNLSFISLVNLGINGVFLVMGTLLYNCCIINERKAGVDMRGYLQLLFVCCLSVFADIFKQLLDGVPEMIWLMKPAVLILFITNDLMLFIYWIYIIDYIGIRDTDIIKKMNTVVRIATLIAVALCVVSFVINGFYFTIDEAGVYSRSWGYTVATVYPVIMQLVCLVLIITSRNKADGFAVITLATFLVAPLVAQVLSAFFPGVAFVKGATMLTMLYMYCVINLQRSKKAVLIKNELETARGIQASLLPSIFPAYPERYEFDVYARMIPAKEVGGDMYDFFFVDDTHFAVDVGAVSGKGVPAALFMMIVKALVKGRAQGGDDMEGIIREVKRQIEKENPGKMQVGVRIAIVDLVTGETVLGSIGDSCNALICRNGRYMPIAEDKFTMKVGDRLFFYTLGLTEAKNENGSGLGLEGLQDILYGIVDLPEKELVDGIEERLSGFSVNESIDYDITMLSFTYRQEYAEPEREAGYEFA